MCVCVDRYVVSSIVGIIGDSYRLLVFQIEQIFLHFFHPLQFLPQPLHLLFQQAAVLLAVPVHVIRRASKQNFYEGTHTHTDIQTHILDAHLKAEGFFCGSVNTREYI